MPVVDGQPVNAAVSNAAWLDAQVDDSALGRITLANTLPESGATVQNTQQSVNYLIQDGKIFITTSTATKITWAAPTLSFIEDILIVFKDTGIVNTIDLSNSPLTIADGESVYVVLDRDNSVSVTPVVAATVPTGINDFRVVTRLGTSLFFYDNTLIRNNRSARIGEAASDILGYQETPTGTVDGINDKFTLSRTPIDDNSIIAMIDYIPVDKSLWTFLGTDITFTTPPATGQQVYVWYLIEGDAVGSAITGTPQVEYRTLDSLNISSKSVILAVTPSSSAKTILDIIGGGTQNYNVDYTVSSNTLSWNGYALDGVLVVGDILRIVYFS